MTVCFQAPAAMVYEGDRFGGDFRRPGMVSFAQIAVPPVGAAYLILVVALLQVAPFTPNGIMVTNHFLNCKLPCLASSRRAQRIL